MVQDTARNKEFEEFYRQTAAGAAGYVRCLCRNQAETEDIVQDGYVAAMRQWDSFSGRGSRKAWLIGILRNTFRSWSRRKKIRAVLSLGLADQTVAAPGEDGRLWQTVESLDEIHRRIVYLRFGGGLSYAELAQVLKIPEGTVRSRLHRALKELKERLSDDERTT